MSQCKQDRSRGRDVPSPRAATIVVWGRLMRRLLLTIAVIVPAAGPSLANDRRALLSEQRSATDDKGLFGNHSTRAERAAAYHNRAVAHAQAGNVDQAIVDYSKTIEIAPNSGCLREPWPCVREQRRLCARTSRRDKGQRASEGCRCPGLTSCGPTQAFASDCCSGWPDPVKDRAAAAAHKRLRPAKSIR